MFVSFPSIEPEKRNTLILVLALQLRYFWTKISTVFLSWQKSKPQKIFDTLEFAIQFSPFTLWSGESANDASRRLPRRQLPIPGVNLHAFGVPTQIRPSGDASALPDPRNGPGTPGAFRARI